MVRRGGFPANGGWWRFCDIEVVSGGMESDDFHLVRDIGGKGMDRGASEGLDDAGERAGRNGGAIRYSVTEWGDMGGATCF